MISDEFGLKLLDLSGKIIKIVNDFKDRDGVTKIRRTYFKYKISEIHPIWGSVGFSPPEIEYLEKDEWDLKSDLIYRVQTIPQYKELRDESQKRYALTGSEQNYFLSSFVQNVINAALDGLGKTYLENLVLAFIRDLNKEPIKRAVKIWIDGIIIGEDREYETDRDYKISNELRIRTLTPNDTEIERPLDSLYKVPLYDYIELSPVILELNCKLRRDEVHNEVIALLCCLRLFRVGSVFSRKVQTRQKSIVEADGTFLYNFYFRYIPHYNYSIGDNNIPILKKFMRTTKDLLPKALFDSSNKIDPVTISIQRYNEALLKTNEKSMENRIASAIMAFEALYLGGSEKLELTHKLSQRASALLNFFNVSPLEVYDTLKLAYDIRSTFVHGSDLRKDTKKKIKDRLEKKRAERLPINLRDMTSMRKNGIKLTHEKILQFYDDFLKTILEYARISILAFLQLEKSGINKEELIKQIDRSLLDKKSYSDLQNQIKKKCSLCFL